MKIVIAFLIGFLYVIHAGQVIEMGEVIPYDLYDTKYGTEIVIYDLNYAVGETSLAFRHRHGYGVSGLLTFYITGENDEQSIVEYKTAKENTDEWNIIDSPNGAISNAYVTCEGIPPNSLPSLHIIEYTHIQLMFGTSDDAPSSLFPSGTRTQIIEEGRYL